MAGAVTVITALCINEPKLAVRVKDPTKPRPTVKANVAEVAFCAIVTEPGVDRATSLTVNPTDDGDEGAELSLAVQLPEPPDATVNGVQTSDASEAGINKEIVNVFELPFSDADIVAFELAGKTPAVAVKATDEEPADAVRIVWETVRLGLSLDRAIEAVDPVGTAFLKVTVQALEARANKKLLTHVTEVGVIGAVNESGAIPTEPFSDAMTVTL